MRRRTSILLAATLASSGCKRWDDFTRTGSGEGTIEVPAGDTPTVVQVVYEVGLPWSRAAIWDLEAEFEDKVESEASATLTAELSADGPVDASLWHRVHYEKFGSVGYTDGWSPSREGDAVELEGDSDGSLTRTDLSMTCVKNDGDEGIDGTICHTQAFLVFEALDSDVTVDVVLSGRQSLLWNRRYLDEPKGGAFTMLLEPSTLDAVTSISPTETPWSY
jgi:hypothetical protein